MARMPCNHKLCSNFKKFETINNDFINSKNQKNFN